MQVVGFSCFCKPDRGHMVSPVACRSPHMGQQVTYASIYIAKQVELPL